MTDANVYMGDDAHEAWLANTRKLNLAIMGLRERGVLTGPELAEWIVAAWQALERSLARPA